jgi:hypothetical protein
MSDKYNAKLEVIIQSEVGPHGKRMVAIKRESHGQQQK